MDGWNEDEKENAFMTLGLMKPKTFLMNYDDIKKVTRWSKNMNSLLSDSKIKSGIFNGMILIDRRFALGRSIRFAIASARVCRLRFENIMKKFLSLQGIEPVKLMQSELLGFGSKEDSSKLIDWKVKKLKYDGNMIISKFMKYYLGSVIINLSIESRKSILSSLYENCQYSLAGDLFEEFSNDILSAGGRFEVCDVSVEKEDINWKSIILNKRKLKFISSNRIGIYIDENTYFHSPGTNLPTFDSFFLSTLQDISDLNLQQICSNIYHHRN
jgi:hypothetical protein